MNLSIRVVEIDHIKDVGGDTGFFGSGKPDPLVELQFHDGKHPAYKTNHINGTREPKFDPTHSTFKIIFGEVPEKRCVSLTASLWDHDTFTKNDLLAKSKADFGIDVADILVSKGDKKGTAAPQWCVGEVWIPLYSDSPKVKEDGGLVGKVLVHYVACREASAAAEAWISRVRAPLEDEYLEGLLQICAQGYAVPLLQAACRAVSSWVHTEHRIQDAKRRDALVQKHTPAPPQSNKAPRRNEGVIHPREFIKETATTYSDLKRGPTAQKEGKPQRSPRTARPAAPPRQVLPTAKDDWRMHNLYTLSLGAAWLPSNEANASVRERGGHGTALAPLVRPPRPRPGLPSGSSSARHPQTNRPSNEDRRARHDDDISTEDEDPVTADDLPPVQSEQEQSPQQSSQSQLSPVRTSRRTYTPYLNSVHRRQLRHGSAASTRSSQGGWGSSPRSHTGSTSSKRNVFDDLYNSAKQRATERAAMQAHTPTSVKCVDGPPAHERLYPKNAVADKDLDAEIEAVKRRITELESQEGKSLLVKEEAERLDALFAK